MTSPKFEVSHQRAEESREVAQIHVSLIPGTPLSNLGVDFLDKCYYRKMIEDDDFVCLVAKFNGRIVGFTSGTFNEKQVYLRCVKKNLVYFFFNIMHMLLTSSLSIASLWNALRCVKDQGKDFGHLKTKLLSIAVLPEYRSREFVKTYQIKIGIELISVWIKLLKDKGIEEYKNVVQKSNMLAIAFYHILDVPIKGETRNSQGEAWIYVGNTKTISIKQSN